MVKINRKMNFLEKLEAGWYWFRECFDEWCYTMMNEGGEFFNYIQSDYVKYEEDTYYANMRKTLIMLLLKPTKPVPKEQSIARTKR